MTMSENEQPRYLLVKRGLYYRPNSQGYTGVKARAGRYQAEDAWDCGTVTAVHEDDAPEFAPACWMETKLAERDATVATLTARLATVEAERDAAVARAERSHETLIHADMKIRSLPHTDQSDVEFIRTAMTDGGGDLIGYASNLARSLVAKYYPDNTGWQPLPDLMGLLTQIDNATTGIAEFGERRAIAASQAQVADWRRREMQAIGAAISTRSWHELERAYNQLRDKMDAMPRSDAVHPSHPPSDLQHYDIGWDNGIAEGRRQATAAIVAWLKQGGATSWTTEAIERGDHLPSAGDAGEG